MNSYLALKSFTNDAIFEEAMHRIVRLHIATFGRAPRNEEVVLVVDDGKLKAVELGVRIPIVREEVAFGRGTPCLLLI